MNILLGNLISLVGSVFLCASCVAKTKRRVVLLQLCQCAVLTVAQIVFGKGAGAVSMSMAGVRNLIIASGHYNFVVMLVIFALTLGLGLHFNTAGYLGLIPVGVGLMYTVALYFARSVRVLKIWLSVLLFCWIIYSAMIFDLFGTISNTAAEVLNIVTLSKMSRQNQGN